MSPANLVVVFAKPPKRFVVKGCEGASRMCEVILWVVVTSARKSKTGKVDTEQYQRFVVVLEKFVVG